MTASTPTTTTELAWSGSEVPDEDELVGTTLCGTYAIERIVGEGGMGRVYLAHHTRIAGKSFAVKTLHPQFLRDKEAVARFQREAEIAAAIDSPHVVGVVDIDATPDGRPFIVCEFLDGVELGAVIDEHGAVPPPYAVPIVRQVCRALSSAHAAGVVHRDVKPENVFLTGNMSQPLAKVLDFGISRLDDGKGNKLTKTGHLMGTPSYMAPEQARGERVNHRADIYGVGGVLYALLTGRAPFDGETVSATIVAVLTEEPARPTTIVPGVPPSLELIVQKAMAKKEDQRYQSMDELFEALAPFDTTAVEQHDGARPQTVLGQPALADEAREIRDARPTLVVLALLALVGLVLAVALFSRGVLLALGVQLTVLERALGWVALVAGSLTPLVLVVRHVRRGLWGNTAKMVEATRTLRNGLVVATTTYACGALLVSFVEGAVFGRVAGTWPLWDVLLVVVAASALLVDIFGRKLRARQPNLATPGLAGVLASGVAGLAVLIVLIAAVRGASTAPEAIAPTADDATKEATDSTTTATGKSDGADSGAGNSDPTKASKAELATASAKGVGSLEALANKYPGDLAVVRQLVLEHAKKAASRHTALKLAGKLFANDRGASSDKAIQAVVLASARDGGKTADLAFTLMASKMRQHGPDLLYMISLTQPTLRERATTLLADATVRAQASEALRIAVDLRGAGGCLAKAQLLDRVAQHGDQRCIVQLTSLMTGRKKGCGFLNLKACPARCSAQANKMRKAVQKLRARRAQQSPMPPRE